MMPETLMGASPNLGMETSKNWPGRTSPENAMRKLYSFAVCRTIPRISDGKGR